MKTIKLILLFVALVLIGTPGTLLFIAAIVCLFQKQFDSAVASLVISLPFLYGAKMCISRIDKIKHPEKYPEKKNEQTEVIPENVKSEKLDVLENIEPANDRGFSPEYEIRYVDAGGCESVRKIYVQAFKGRCVTAYCFLRREERTFVVSNILECIDLETGELIKEDLHFYFNEKYHTNYKMKDMFNYEDWTKVRFAEYAKLPDEISGFDIDEKFKMKIVTYDNGIVYDDFTCQKILSSLINEGQYYITMRNKDGEGLNVELEKILSVDGIENFGEYLTRKFYESDVYKSASLLQKFSAEIYSLVYLGRADSSMTPQKRKIICDYLVAAGAVCNDDVISGTLKKVRVDDKDFKKCVNALANSLDDSKKKSFLETALAVVGGRDKAKPFGAAGLQYIESKIKV